MFPQSIRREVNENPSGVLRLGLFPDVELVNENRDEDALAHERVDFMEAVSVSKVLMREPPHVAD